MIKQFNEFINEGKFSKYNQGTAILPCGKLNLKSGINSIFNMNFEKDSFIEVWEDQDGKYRLVMTSGTKKIGKDRDEFIHDQNQKKLFNGKYVDGCIANEFSKLEKYGNSLSLYVYK